MKQKGVWLSYDLGFRGDYEALYAWLDDHKAKECGDNLAYFRFDCEGNIFQALKSELSKVISLDKSSRIYAMCKVEGEEKGRFQGRFVVGRRRQAPWSGYGSLSEQEEDEADSPTNL